MSYGESQVSSLGWSASSYARALCSASPLPAAVNAQVALGDKDRGESLGELGLKQILEFLVRYAGALEYCFQSVGVDSFVLRDCRKMPPIAHGDVFFAADDPKSFFGQNPNHPVRGEVGEKHQAGTWTSTKRVLLLTLETASKYSEMAERMFSRASFSVSPWPAQPGRAGQAMSYPYLLL